MIEENQKKSFLQKKWATVCILGLVISAIGVGSLLYYKLGGSHNSIPAETRNAFALPIFYPSSLPDGYSYKKDSAIVKNGILFYRIGTNDSVISLSQQVRPEKDPGLEYLLDFSPLDDVPAGTAYSGKEGNSPVVLLLTDRTFITITGESDIPPNVISLLTKKLKPVD